MKIKGVSVICFQQLLGPGALFPEGEAKRIVLDGQAALDL
jgi:hypothetical protein